MSKVYVACAVLILGVGLYLGAQDVDRSGNTASVRGRIIFGGTLPPVQPTQMNADPYCALLGETYAEGWEDVIVYAKPLGQTSFPAPGPSVTLEHRGCRYVPHTLTLEVGQKLVIRNSDATAHNTHIWSSINGPFNFAMRAGAGDTIKIFDKEETRVPIRDDIHNWESANIGVFSHPYHTVSKLNGEFQFALPAGSYEIVAWHERLGTQTKLFEVRTGETPVVDLVFK